MNFSSILQLVYYFETKEIKILFKESIQNLRIYKTLFLLQK